MAFIKFGELLKDLPDYRNPGCLEANNVIPYGDGYKPLPSLNIVSDALDNRAQGLGVLRSTDGTIRVVAGDSSKLYLLDGSSFNDVSKLGGYTVSSLGQWSFTIFGNRIIASAIGQNIQSFTIGTSTEFADLVSLQTKYVTTVRDFLVTGFNASQSQRVRWSAINDPTDFTVSQTTQSDFQDLVGDHGQLQMIKGGEYLVTFMERAIYRGDYVGTPLIFQFTKVDSNIGVLKSGSVVQYGNNYYFLAEDGFYMFNGRTAVPIGANKINKFFFNDLSNTYLDRISGAVDPRNQLIVWAYPSQSSSGELDKVIMYNYLTQRWSTGEVNTQILGQAQTPGYTLEELDTISASLDDLNLSLDSPFWSGSRLFLSAFNTDNKLATFSGTPGTANLLSSQLEIEGRRSSLRNVRPIVSGGTTTVQTSSIDRQGNTETLKPAISLTDSGDAPMRSTGRYHKVQLNITGDFDDCLGFDAELVNEGKR